MHSKDPGNIWEEQDKALGLTSRSRGLKVGQK